MNALLQRINEAKQRAIPEVAEAIDSNKVDLFLGYHLLKKSKEEQLKLLPKCIEVTEFMRELCK